MSGIYEFGYRTPRFRADFHFLLQTEGPPPRLLDARCLDISEEGIAAQVADHLTVGAVVTLMLTFPGNSTTWRIPAKVCNRQDEDHGFAFIFSSQSERDDVRRYVASLHGDTVRMISRSK
jgi:hypothetical protein